MRNNLVPKGVKLVTHNGRPPDRAHKRSLAEDHSQIQGIWISTERFLPLHPQLDHAGAVLGGDFR